jgi:hypothetical protein
LTPAGTTFLHTTTPPPPPPPPPPPTPLPCSCVPTLACSSHRPGATNVSN